MRISKFMLPAVTVAGALALAGCGGGSGGEDPPKMMDPIVKEEEEETVDFSPATLPGTASGIVYNADSRRTILVGKGKHAVGDSNVSVMCEADTGCAYRVVASGGSVSIETTNGATVVLTNPVPQTAQPQDSGHWLSKASVLAAIPNTDDSSADDVSLTFTINGVKETVVANPASNAFTDTTPDPKVANLRLRTNRNAGDDTASDFLVWGAWEEPGVDGATAKHHQVWTGSTPYSGKPASTLGGDDGIATYAGADGDVHGFFKGLGSGSWREWTGTPTLTANFRKGRISGSIVPTTTTLLGTDDSNANIGATSISLKETAIGATFNGSASITTHGTGGGANSSGSWEGGFFGAGSGLPTGAAGSFNVRRPAANGKGTLSATGPQSPVKELVINGAFGIDPSTAPQ